MKINFSSWNLIFDSKEITNFRRNEDEQFSNKKIYNLDSIKEYRLSGKISLGWAKLLHRRETQFAMGGRIGNRRNANTRRRNESDERLVLGEMDHCSARWFDDHLLCQIKRSRHGDLRAWAPGRACRPLVWPIRIRERNLFANGEKRHDSFE